ncbi:MAG: MogA/MoaB family molybdenum cofactor biosynthesis protein [Planctomycetota bacterium]
MLRTAVITVSDRASRGEYADRSGPAICACLHAAYPDMAIEAVIVPDEAAAIRKALDRFADRDWIITTGGTGIGPRDITPEVTAAFCDRPLPGIAEILRAESYRETPAAMLARGYAGVRGRTVVVNVPGSVKAAAFCARILTPVMAHARDMLAGKGH